MAIGKPLKKKKLKKAGMKETRVCINFSEVPNLLQTHNLIPASRFDLSQ